MDSVIDIDAARALVGDAALWPRVRDFLWDFAPQIHTSWLKGVQPLDNQDNMALLESLKDSPRSKSWILSSLGVEPCFHGFMKADWSRLALLDGATLLEIVKWLGALRCADALRRVTAGATVRELKAALPGVYPEVFGYTMYFRSFASSGDIEAQCLLSAVVEEGGSILLSALSGQPSCLVSRFRLKLPKEVCDAASLRGAGVPPADAGAVLTKLLKLKFPEAYSLCCS